MSVFIYKAIVFAPLIWTDLDVRVFEQTAKEVSLLRMEEGGTFLTSTYPPPVTALFWIIDSLPSLSFLEAWIVFLVSTIIAAAAYDAFFLKQSAPAYTIPLIVVLTTILTTPLLVFARYDILVGLFVYLSLSSWKSKKVSHSMFWILAASAFKVLPTILIPLLIILTPSKKRKYLLSGAILALIIFAGIPAIIMGPQRVMERTLAIASYHQDRTAQIETTMSGIQMMLGKISGQRTEIQYNNYTTRNMSVPAWALSLAGILTIIGLGTIYGHTYTHRSTGSSFERYTLVALLWILITAPAFSPQYLLWFLVPALGWVVDTLDNNWRTVLFMLLLGTSAIATGYIYPHHYLELVLNQQLFEIVILNIRNVSLLLLIGTVWQRSKAIAQTDKRLQHRRDIPAATHLFRAAQ